MEKRQDLRKVSTPLEKGEVGETPQSEGEKSTVVW